MDEVVRTNPVTTGLSRLSIKVYHDTKTRSI